MKSLLLRHPTIFEQNFEHNNFNYSKKRIPFEASFTDNLHRIFNSPDRQTDGFFTEKYYFIFHGQQVLRNRN